MNLEHIQPRSGKLVRISLVVAFLASVGPSMAAERPMLATPADSFETYYGKPEKSFETLVGVTRMWKRSGLLLTHVDGKDGGRRLTVQKVDGSEVNCREAFAIAERFCGKQAWSMQSQNDEVEVYANSDRALLLTYQKARQAGGINYVAISLLPPLRGIEDL